MHEIYNKYEEDLNKIKRSILIFEYTDDFARETYVEENEITSEFITKARLINNKFRENRDGAVTLPGILMLYVAGRFEHFVRMIFEETSSRVAIKFSEFRALPKNFQDTLIEDTSKVIQDPRKYRHGIGARDSFIRNLHNNIHLNDLSVINYQCISITEQNMKAKVLSGLFSKINYNNIWADICSQANIRQFFEGADVDKAKSECMAKLDQFMELRNNIAHPSDSITWISTTEAINYIIFFTELGRSIKDVCPIHVMKTIPST